MGKGRPIPPLNLSEDERSRLETIVRRRLSTQAEARRAQVILACADGLSNQAVSERTGVCAHSVGIWRRRFLADRMDGLADLPRSGPPRKISDEQVAEVLRLTLETKPENATHWSTRKMAAKAGISNERVARIWQSFGLKPHRVESFQLSTDPFFVEKVRDVVGLYMSPPESALVLCVDEKSQIQALERSQPVLPLLPGCGERQSHDYFRHGTTTLFAALNIKTGEVLSQCHSRHTHTNSSLHFCERSRKRFPVAWMCIWLWTTTRPTKPLQCASGSRAGLTGTRTSSQPTAAG